MTGPAVGTELAPVQQTFTLTDMVAYAGATWDWHRMHYDPVYIAERGLPAPVVDGQVFGALLVRQAHEALGPAVFIRRLHFRFANLVFAGETVRCTARVTGARDLDDGTVLLTLAASVDVVGDQARPAVAPAGLEVVLR